ncbi:NTP transferase domain-containing protein [Antribacter sp. KLBMP9083]|uniref:Phosphoenolpyruvate guanylyltransferase n=1 Tax=Antribacter soli TaxID=2910976 RepID=A0AA41UCI8_9MICO|nr:NTP transferase domain-containing protein [Antribacter soli]MCF4122114.1 NTP transferase domain-containing protein [Antribacter soli]
MSAAGRVVAVVPLRDGVSGKSRLAAVLDPAARRRLVTVLARHVVAAVLAVDAVERVVVVTADPAFVREALAGLDLHDRLDILEQPADRPGLNAGLDVAREYVLGAAPRLLVAHADLPALTPQDVTVLLTLDADVVIATDRVGAGTNLLLLPLHPGLPDAGRSPGSTTSPAAGREPGDGGFRFHFGLGSRAAHEAEAARLGLRSVTVHGLGTAVDLDTTDDWGELPGEVRSAVGQHVPGLPGIETG